MSFSDYEVLYSGGLTFNDRSICYSKAASINQQRSYCRHRWLSRTRYLQVLSKAATLTVHPVCAYYDAVLRTSDKS